MPENDPREAGPGQPETSLGGRLSALLRDLARVPEEEIGSTWTESLEPGEVIGRFELLREVGRGGFGIVYEAQDRDLGRKVAFKAVRAGVRPDVREERLLREAEAAARLSHPNIVTLFDVGRSPFGPYLVFELLRGRTLGLRLRDGAVPIGEALRIALEVAKGIAHAHANGVVHRDLTPGNVFLCDDGQVKLLDLGMAHAFGRPRLEGGTPGYMAPEQRRGAPEDERADVFALGVILYRMVTGKLPFHDRADAPPAPALYTPEAPGVGALIARMLALDAAERPRDGGVVVSALAPIVRELDTPPEWRAPGHRPRRTRRAIVASVAAAGLAAAVAVTWIASRGSARVSGVPAAAAVLPSIAVLPFDDLSPGGDQAYLSDGLADEILTALGHVSGVRVPARTSSFYLKSKGATLAEIGRRLNVSAVLQGSVRTAGNRVQITAEIVTVPDGARVWTQSFDRELSDVFAVHDEIAGAVVTSLHVKGRAPAVSAAALAPRDAEAYRQYLIGMHHSRRFTPESLALSVQAFERAVALDPSFAPAWAGMAVPALVLASREKSPDAIEKARRRALSAAEKALQLAPDLADGYAARAAMRSSLEYDWEGARSDLERALALNGIDADARRRYATLLAALGRLPEAIVQARRATELDPLSGSWGKLGLLYQAAGELDRADAAFRRGLEVWPDDFQIQIGLAQNLLLASRPGEALAVFDRLPNEELRLWGTAVVKHSLGDAAASNAALAALAARYPYTDSYQVATIHAWRGERDAAFAALERAVAQHEGNVVAIQVDPFLASLRGDPRFAALLRRMKLRP